jgi:hypothetical protein
VLVRWWMNGKDYQTNGIGFPGYPPSPVPSCMPHTAQVGDSGPFQLRTTSHYQTREVSLVERNVKVRYPST